MGHSQQHLDFGKETPNPRKHLKEKSKVEINPERAEFARYALAPLENVILPRKQLDDIVTRCGIPQILSREEPQHHGAVFYGPPGTGKTVLLKALVEVFENLGADSGIYSLSELNVSFVGAFASNIEKVLSSALEKATENKVPSFIAFDEGSILVQSAVEGAFSVSKHYQEAIDVLKTHIGNDPNLVMVISTNLEQNSLEKSLTREGRLTSFRIDLPGEDERKRLWHHFLRQHNLYKGINQSHLERLAHTTAGYTGAFIHEFCKTYREALEQEALRSYGFSSTMSALKQGVRIPELHDSQDISNTIVEKVKERIREAEKRSEGIEMRIGYKPTP